MRVAVLGTGGIGRGYAAYLAAHGHAPVLWSPTGRGLAPPGVTLAAGGMVAGSWSVAVAEECGEAVRGAEAVVIAVDGRGLRATIDALAPHLGSGQACIISAHLSFAALYLSRKLAERGVTLPISAWATTALTARSAGPASVHVSGLRSRLDIATMPVRFAERGRALACALFGERFEPRADMLAIMLSNLNPPAHMANMLCNFTRAEKGEWWANYGGITPSVARLIEALDSERLALASGFGCSVRSVHEHYTLSFGVPRASLADMSAAVFAQKPELAGPATPATRYVLEDVPFGLVPLEALARSANLSLPLHSAGIALFSALYGTDFALANDLLPALGIAGWPKERLLANLREGWGGEMPPPTI